MRYIKHRNKTMLHINDVPGHMWKVRCGAYTFHGEGGGYNSSLQIIDPQDISKYHHCIKCFQHLAQGKAT